MKYNEDEMCIRDSCGDTGIDELHTFLKVKMFLSGFGREDNHNIIRPLYV